MMKGQALDIKQIRVVIENQYIKKACRKFQQAIQIK